jgi:NADPH2:quinone reductase
LVAAENPQSPSQQIDNNSRAMKAIVNTANGGPEVIEVRDVPEPQPQQGEVLVKVSAVGLNFADILATKGEYAGGPKAPFVGGREFCGVRVDTGERVMGYADYGAFAEYFAAKPHRIWAAPKRFSDIECAAFPVNFFTAYLAYWKAGLVGNDADPERPIHSRRPRALIHAVAGGVGTAAVQIGKQLGIEMYGTSSSDGKLQGVFELGLDHGLNYTRQDWEALIREHTNGEGVDAVFDAVGGETTAKSLRCLAFLGRCILYGAASGAGPEINGAVLYGRMSSVHGLWLSRLINYPEIMQKAVAALMPWVEEGKLKPAIGHRMKLEEMAEAYRLMLDKKNFGKIVLTV